MNMENNGVTRTDKRLLLRLALIAALAVSVSFIPYAAMRFAGLYINLTGSMARGIWKACARSQSLLKAGAFRAF